MTSYINRFFFSKHEGKCVLVLALNTDTSRDTCFSLDRNGRKNVVYKVTKANNNSAFMKIKHVYVKTYHYTSFHCVLGALYVYV